MSTTTTNTSTVNTTNIFVTTRSFRINAILSLIKNLLKTDSDIDPEVKNMESVHTDSIFDDDEMGKNDSIYVKDEKIKLYKYLSDKGYGKQMMIDISKERPIVGHYYNSFFKDYDKAFNGKIHIPILFVNMCFIYLEKKDMLFIDKDVYDTHKINFTLLFKSNITREEKTFYRNLVEKMFTNVSKVTTQRMKNKNKNKKRKNRRK